MSHTATPWFVGAMNDCLFIIDQPPRPDAGVEGGGPPASVIAKLDYPDAEGNAELIRRACNCHCDLLAACKTALDHVRELRDAWMRGAINERDRLGGTRSNRNVDVEVALAAAIARAEGKPDGENT